MSVRFATTLAMGIIRHAMRMMIMIRKSNITIMKCMKFVMVIKKKKIEWLYR